MGKTADERGGKPVQITGAWRSGRGSGPNYVANVFVFLCSVIICRLYKLTISLQLRVGLSDLV
jgi:hypothetical protein